MVYVKKKVMKYDGTTAAVEKQRRNDVMKSLQCEVLSPGKDRETNKNRNNEVLKGHSTNIYRQQH